MRIAIVNDTRIAIAGLRKVVLNHGHEVAWIAMDGAQAVEAATKDTPDLILMDLIMPVMNGVEATRRIMVGSPCAILIVTASVGAHAPEVFAALSAGALDSVKTPTIGLDGSGSGAEILIAKIEALEKVIKGASPLVDKTETRSKSTRADQNLPLLVAIGASAGGPRAIASLLAALPSNFSGAIVIVQHLDMEFAAGLVSWLEKQSAIPIFAATDGATLSPGVAWLARTSGHAVVGEDGLLHYHEEPQDAVYHPSVDVFFESIVQNWRGRAIGVLLTGMGRDGATGLLSMRNQGFHTIAQDKASSTVYGMPRAAAENGAAAEVLAIDDIARTLIRKARPWSAL